MFWLAMVTLHLTPYYRGIRYHTDTLPGSRKILYTFGEGAPDWMYRVPPFRMLDVGDHSMERYVKHAKTWAEAAKAGAADVE